MVEILKSAYMNALNVETVPESICILYQLVAPLLLDHEVGSVYGDLAIISFADSLRINEVKV